MRSGVNLDLLQEVRQFLCVDTRIVHRPRGLQDVARSNLARRVSPRMAMGDGVAEDLPRSLKRPLGDVPRASAIDDLNHRYELGSLDLRDGTLAQRRQNVALEAAA